MHTHLQRGLAHVLDGTRRVRSLDRAAIATFDPEDVPSVPEIAVTLEEGDFGPVQVGNAIQ